MSKPLVDIQVEILNFLKDGDYHSLLATVLGVANNLHMTKNEIYEIYDSRKKNTGKYTIASTIIHNQVRTEVSKLRKAKFIKNFPKSKDIGVFGITEKGLEVLLKDKNEKKRIINQELAKYNKSKRTKK